MRAQSHKLHDCIWWSELYLFGFGFYWWIGTVTLPIIYSSVSCCVQFQEYFRSQMNNLPTARGCQSDSHVLSTFNWMAYSKSIKWQYSNYCKVAP